MGLVDELQDSATREDVLTIIRKARRVSAKLGRTDLSQWLDREQNGYVELDSVPEYRRVSATICYNTNGYIPAGFGMLQNGISPMPHLRPVERVIKEPIGTICSWLEGIRNQRHAVHESLDGEMADWLRSQFQCSIPGLLDRLTFSLRFEGPSLQNTVEQVKNKILDWACQLEAAGVTGDNHSFSKEERKAAETIIFNINHSSIDQLNTMGRNVRHA